jgi:tRNA(fMet)-specific endonuclease VapC
MYLLDTNIFSYIYKNKNSILANKLTQIAESQIAICSIVLAELIFGAFNSQSKTKELLEYYGEISKKLVCFDFDKKSAVIFGELKNNTRVIGKTIDDIDLMVAGICLANDLILVTNNVKHFKNIPNLQIENWTIDE